MCNKCCESDVPMIDKAILECSKITKKVNELMQESVEQPKKVSKYDYPIVNSYSIEERKKMIEQSFETILDAMGVDRAWDENFFHTPHRVAKMYVYEIFKWLFQSIDDLNVSTFNNAKEYGWIVMVGPLEVKSVCAHHFQPFIGNARIGYVPKNRLIGLSKFSRIVDHFSRKPQTQELLVEEIAQFLMEKLNTKDVAVVIKAEHFCMKLRWVEEPCAQTATTSMNGIFMHWPSARDEFYKLIQL